MARKERHRWSSGWAFRQPTKKVTFQRHDGSVLSSQERPDSPEQRDERMTELLENEAITEALEIIDRQLGHLLHRELVSTAEVIDVLLDVRSLLAATTDIDPVAATLPAEAVPVPN